MALKPPAYEVWKTKIAFQVTNKVPIQTNLWGY